MALSEQDRIDITDLINHVVTAYPAAGRSAIAR